MFGAYISITVWSAGSGLALSVIASQCQLSQRESLWPAGRLSASPFGRGGCDQREQTERASRLRLFVLLLHLGALVHMVQLHGGRLHVGMGDVRGDDAVAVQVLAGDGLQHRLGLGV